MEYSNSKLKLIQFMANTIYLWHTFRTPGIFDLKSFPLLMFDTEPKWNFSWSPANQGATQGILPEEKTDNLSQKS